MKRNFIILILLFSFTGSALAHPPTELSLDYDKENHMLKVKIVHPTSNMNKHYIRRINVKKNGDDFTVIKLFRQPHPKEFIKEIPMELQDGDEISVKVFCKKGGTKTAELIVPYNKENTENINAEPGK